MNRMMVEDTELLSTSKNLDYNNNNEFHNNGYESNDSSNSDDNSISSSSSSSVNVEMTKLSTSSPSATKKIIELSEKEKTSHNPCTNNNTTPTKNTSTFDEEQTTPLCSRSDNSHDNSSNCDNNPNQQQDLTKNKNNWLKKKLGCMFVIIIAIIIVIVVVVSNKPKTSAGSLASSMAAEDNNNNISIEKEDKNLSIGGETHDEEQHTITISHPDKPSSLSLSCPKLIWNDEFNGSQLNESLWKHQNGNGCDIGLCGWGNNELQVYTPENTIINNGILTIEGKYNTNTNQYTSSKLITRDTTAGGTFNIPGRIEAKIRIPYGQGMWPAFWMLSNDDKDGWPKSGEIDIMENIGKELDTIYGSIHYGPSYNDHQYITRSYQLQLDDDDNNNNNEEASYSDSFHVYTIEREENRISWYMDDILYSTITINDILPYKYWPFNKPFYIILNLAIGGDWPGNPDSTTTTQEFPKQMQVDYVRVYSGKFPKLIGPSKISFFSMNNDDGATTTTSGSTKVVTFAVEEVDEDNNNDTRSSSSSSITYEWEVPPKATIINGQGTKSVQVKFTPPPPNDSASSRMMIAVKINNPNCSIKSRTIQMPVEVVIKNNPPITCGCPETCTKDILQRNANGHICEDRIQWLMDTQDLPELDACYKVSKEEFSTICGNPQCNYKLCNNKSNSGNNNEDNNDNDTSHLDNTETGIITCGCPHSCTQEMLQKNADGYTCEARIRWLMNEQGMSEHDACLKVSDDEFPNICGPQCNSKSCHNNDKDHDHNYDNAQVPPTTTSKLPPSPLPPLPSSVNNLNNNNSIMITCGCQESCTQEILQKDADGFSCQERIQWLMNDQGLSETDACYQVSNQEFPTICGPQCNPQSCTRM